MSKKISIFTIIQNEDFFLNIWLNYYKKFFSNEDIYILNHSSTTPTCLKILSEQKAAGVNIVNIHRDVSFDHAWLRNTVEKFQSFLLQSYECVVFAECDEIISPNPSTFNRGLYNFILERFKSTGLDILKCAGFNVEHDVVNEPDIDLSKKVLMQRNKWRRTFIYDKPLISKVPCEWVNGFHTLSSGENVPLNTDLILIHLHKMDYKLCINKHEEQAKRKWNQYDLDTFQGDQNRIFEKDKFDEWFFGGNKDQKTENFLINIPAWFKDVV